MVTVVVPLCPIIPLVTPGVVDAAVEARAAAYVPVAVAYRFAVGIRRAS
jgi:hypothetical protein